MANSSHQRDYCLWNNKKSPANISKKAPMDDAFNVKHKKQDLLFSFSASAQDLRHIDLEEDKEDTSPARQVLEGLTTSCSSLRARFHWAKLFKLWKKRSIKHLACFPPTGVPKITELEDKSTRENPVLCNLYNFRSSLVNFSLSDLRNATNNFSNENLIGRGGYAEVYKGRLQDGQLIAVKRLNRGTPDERTSSFLAELGIIAHVDHPNTAKLIGCCVEGEMHLVFQLSLLGSLGSLLHGPDKNKLDWCKRYKIALGIADGLLYLHENCHRRIIHRDIKADNILLTENFEPLICDFGLAKWLPEQCTHHNVSKFEGTFGYFAPEYLLHGIVNEKIDVYSYGVLLLEIITGRPALDYLQQSIVLWAKPLLDTNNVKDLLDPSLGDAYDPEEMDRVVLTASLCVEQSPMLRPRMSQVAILLRGDDFVLEFAKESRRRSLPRTYSEEIQDAQEYNSTNNLSRHKEVAVDS